MCFGLDFLECFFDDSFFVDDVCAALHALVFVAEHLFLDEYIICVRDFFVYVCEQDERQVILYFEFHVAFFAVGADADEDCFFFNCRILVPECAGFFRAAGRFVFWIEIKHYLSAAVV